jgi:hypothetical protein
MDLSRYLGINEESFDQNVFDHKLYTKATELIVSTSCIEIEKYLDECDQEYAFKIIKVMIDHVRSNYVICNITFSYACRVSRHDKVASQHLIDYIINKTEELHNDKLTEIISNGLRNACIKGDPDLIDYLLSKGASPHEGLIGACYCGDIELFEKMISKGANLLSEPIHCCVCACEGYLKTPRDHITIIFRILDLNPEALNHTFYKACSIGSTDLVEYLIGMSIPGNKCNINQGLIISVHNCHLNAVKLLVKKGATNLSNALDHIHLRINKELHQPSIHLYTYMNPTKDYNHCDIDKYIQIAKYLLENGATFSSQFHSNVKSIYFIKLLADHSKDNSLLLSRLNSTQFSIGRESYLNYILYLNHCIRMIQTCTNNSITSILASYL